MSKFPTRVLIGGVKHRVTSPKALSDKLYGVYHEANRLIQLNPRLNNTEDLKYETLMHEVTHGALSVSGLSNLLSDKEEEAVVCMIDTILIPAILRIQEQRHK